MVFDVRRHKTNDPPCPEDGCYEKPEEADNECGRILPSDFHGEM